MRASDEATGGHYLNAPTLAEILRKVEQGERFTITVRGRAVADVVPTQARDQRALEEAVERLRHPRIKGIPGETVLDWIKEGRK